MVQEIKYTPDKIISLEPHQIMVFPSNLLGIHGKGAAKDALQFGAKRGIGTGMQGQTYALATKATPYKRLPIVGNHELDITYTVELFIRFAKTKPELEFLVTKVGCGNAGYTPEQIAPLFKEALQLNNVVLPREFHEILTLNV